MEEQKKKMKKAERKHKLFLLMLHFAKMLINFARRGIKPFADGPIHGAISLFVRFILVFILLSIKQEIAFVLITYVVIHAICFIVGKQVYNFSEKLLNELDGEANILFVGYLADKLNEYQIVDDLMFFDDSIVVGNGDIVAPMRQTCDEISIYHIENNEEYGDYYYRTIDSQDSGVSLNEKIASSKFNKKFGIIVEKGKEMDAINFFSPTLQLRMIETPEMDAFTGIKIKDGIFRANIGKPIPYPTYIDIFKWKPLTKHIKEIDAYCKKLRNMGDTAYANLMKIDFIRGN